jgi:hypothetical protein
MRFLRFSLRRLFVFTALFAVALYVLIFRPAVVAARFAHDVEVAAVADFESVSKQYFGNMRTDQATLEVQLHPRSWNDVLRCRQLFQMRMVRPGGEDNLWIMSVHDFYATPIGVTNLRGPLALVRRGPQTQ